MLRHKLDHSEFKSGHEVAPQKSSGIHRRGRNSSPDLVHQLEPMALDLTVVRRSVEQLIAKESSSLPRKNKWPEEHDN